MELSPTRRLLLGATLVFGWCLTSAPPARAALDLVSRSSFGEQARAASYQPAISADGRHVAFVSDADNLVDNDPQSWYFGADPDVFVFDRETGAVENASAALNREGLWFLRTVCRDPSIDAAGRFVAFECFSGYHFAHGMQFDIYLSDRQSGGFVKITKGLGGSLANDGSSGAALSADGRFVAFSSKASNLHPQDTDRVEDVYIYDREAASFELVSVAGSGEKGNGPSHAPALSADGRFIAFASTASNLASGPGDGLSAVFVRDRQTGTTERIAPPAGTTGAGSEPSISADGRLVAFSVSGDGASQVLLADRVTGSVRPVAAGSSPSLSGDGRFLAFVAAGQIQQLDLASGRLATISSAPSGETGNAPSAAPSLSRSGAELAFASAASNLCDTDGNGVEDVFLHTSSVDVTPPTLELSVSPDVLWPPNKKYVKVTVDGLAEDDTDLDSVDLEITVTDEYGEMQGRIVYGFGESIELEAWREGDDLDGRVYTITAIASDRAGNTVEKSVEVVVPHDMRDKKK